MTPTEHERRSIAQLVTDIAYDTARLVRREIDLARVEVTEKAQRMGVGAAFVAFAFFALCVAFAVAVAGVVVIVAEWMDPWLAAFVVALVVLGVAAIAAGIGVVLIRRTGTLAPEESINQAQKDIEWLKEQPTSKPTSTPSSGG